MHDINTLWDSSFWESNYSPNDSECELIVNSIYYRGLPDNDNLYYPFGMHTFVVRDKYIKKYGFLVVTDRLVNTVADILKGSKVLEVMCGTGHFGRMLKSKGTDIIQTDNFSWSDRLDISEDIENLDAIQAIDKYGKDMDYIIMSWSPYEDNIDLKVLQEMRKVNPNCKLLVVTEGFGGCIGSDKFHEEIQDFNEFEYLEDRINTAKSEWIGVHDHFRIVK